MTEVDVALIEAWARYRAGRDHVGLLLDETARATLELLRVELRKRYGRRVGLSDDELVGIVQHGDCLATRRMDEVALEFRIPAIVKDAALVIAIGNWDGYPELVFRVLPWEPDDAPAFRRAGKALLAAGYEEETNTYRRSDRLATMLKSKDPARSLMKRIAEQVPTIVGSGMLDKRCLSNG